MKKTIKGICFFILPAVVLISACAKQEGRKEETDTTMKNSVEEKQVVPQAGSFVEISELKFQNSGIEFGQIQQRNLKDIVKCNGILTLPPQNKANISSLIPGTVKNVYVIEGDLVKKGKVLATLLSHEAIQIQEEYVKSNDNLSFLLTEFERQKELLDQKVTSLKKYQEAEAAYKSTRGRVNSLKDQLLSIGLSPQEVAAGNTTTVIPIRAPIDGYVRKIDINIGTFVAAAKEMFEIVDLHHLHIDLQAFESDFSKIQIGQKVNVYLPNQNNGTIQAEVFATGKAFENDSRSVTIHAEIKNNKNKALIPGMYVNAFIETGLHKVPSVPDEAIVSNGGKDYIFVFQDKAGEGDSMKYRFKLVEVKRGITEDGFAEIKLLEPIGENTQVVIKGAYYLSSELKKEEGE